MKRWNKVYLIVTIVLLVIVCATSVYLFIVSQRNKTDVSERSYETKVIEACTDDAVGDASVALQEEDGQKLYDLVSAAQKDKDFRTNARCVYVAVLYSVATEDQSSAKHYLSIYESLPANARMTLESIEGSKKLAELQEMVAGLKTGENALPDSTPATEIDPSSESSSSVFIYTVPSAPADDGGGQ